MLHSINKEFLDGLALVVPIVYVVRLGGGKPNWAMSVAILASVVIASSIQTGFGLGEQFFPVLCAAFVGRCVLLAMSLSKGRVACGKLCGNAG
ncbi:hypothetical protein [Xanthomonas graminis]|uniref:hypothetical protein n=1 Tax=Xanthomonas graminis TaxID=3390026 RepID=UPI00083A2B91|nr:hypothetical protein [Xanthomonas translucens]